jgi:AraC-like DNA-binding protein
VISCFYFEHSEAHHLLHQHDEGQFFILLTGAAGFITAQGERVMTMGRPCWVPPGVEHGVSSRGLVAGISLFVHRQLCADLPAHICIYQGYPFIVELVERMRQLCEDSQRLLNLWRVVVDELCAAEQDEFYLPVPRDARLRRLTDVLVRHPADPRRIEDWALDLGISQRTLVRKFRHETGMSFIKWRQHARVLYAIKLLAAGESVTEVAPAVGYESLSAFIAVFRQLTGVAPSHYGTFCHETGQTSSNRFVR